ncbi:hypothetical protein Gogos_008890 [Gossypium gossypioides]|uniref:RNase H type-1 domain-containing protein n=1 Tax=Gossypium gossypioides TaxID=34282 RepID=A0A7J9CDY6_GOSGO|nr:hypothetical protein [Gossypium gossypioides]
MAEAMAVLHGLQFAQEMGFQRIILESDSRTLYRFNFAPRGCNTTAHAMVALGRKESTDQLWVEDVPLEA